MLADEFQLGQLAKILEVLGHGVAAGSRISGRQQKVAKDLVAGIAVALLEVIARTLVNILSSPEGTVGNVNIDSQTSGWSRGRVGLHS